MAAAVAIAVAAAVAIVVAAAVAAGGRAQLVLGSYLEGSGETRQILFGNETHGVEGAVGWGGGRL